MSTRRFEYRDEKSNKFWEITVDGNEHTVRYGRIGSDGQSKTKSFDSDEAAGKDAAKLIGQKTKKGYEEVAGSTDAVGPAARFRALLGSLCRDGEDEKILDALCAAVVEMDDDTIVFEDEWECEYELGQGAPEYDGVPASFRAIASSVKALAWDGGGPEVGYSIGDDGSPDADNWLFGELKHDRPEECAKIEAAGPVVASFLAGQNGLFFDPTSKLSNGEPGLAFVSHEGGGWVTVESVAKLDYGQILLRMVSDAMIETDYIPEIYF